MVGIEKNVSWLNESTKTESYTQFLEIRAFAFDAECLAYVYVEKGREYYPSVDKVKTDSPMLGQGMLERRWLEDDKLL